LDQEGVSVVIPGARNATQAQGNAAAAALQPLSRETHTQVREVYDDLVPSQVHHLWGRYGMAAASDLWWPPPSSLADVRVARLDESLGAHGLGQPLGTGHGAPRHVVAPRA